MGLKTTSSNEHNLDFPITSHHINQMIDELSTQKERLQIGIAKVERLAHLTKGLNQYAAFGPRSTSKIVDCLNILRDIKYDINMIDSSYSHLKREVQWIKSKEDADAHWNSRNI